MAKDKYHNLVRSALEAEGWIITSDPFYIRPEKGINYPVDLAAERVLVAEKGTEKIAVEVQEFFRGKFPA